MIRVVRYQRQRGYDVDYSVTLQALIPALAALLGALIGAVASVLTTRQANDNARKLSEASARREKEAASESFQRENYLELQDVLITSTLSVFLCQTRRNKRLAANRCDEPYEDDSFIECMSARWPLVKLLSRSLSDTVRSLGAEYVTAADAVIMAASKDEAKTSDHAFMEAHKRLQDAIGVELRLVL